MRFAIRVAFGWFVGVGLANAMVCSCVAVDFAKETALRFAEEDCDFFAGGLHLSEQWAQFENSQLYREVSQVPLVKSAIQSWQEEWKAREGQVGQLRGMIDNPNVESLLKLAREMFSDEFFALADNQASAAILGITELSGEMNAIAVSGDPAALEDFFMELPKSEIDNIPVPTIVIGFKVKNHELILGRLDQLEALIRFGLGSIPIGQSFVEGLERIEDARGTRLTWTIIPEMVPWSLLRQNIALGGQGDAGAMTGKLQSLFEDRELCVTIGQLDDYLIFSLSEDQDAISNLGKSGSLIKNSHMKPLLDKANEVITSVGYVSDKYADADFQSRLKGFFFRQTPTVQQAILAIYGADIPEELQSVSEDLIWLDEQIDELVPEIQGQTAFSFLTKSGSEFWNYARTENVVFDASKPLSILEHVGKDPIAMLVCRLQDRPEHFATARRIVRKIKDYLDLVPESEGLSDSNRDAWREFLNRGWPFIVDLADILEKQFMPAMKEGQHAWVLHEGTLTSKKWFKEMPESKKPLAIPDTATVTGIYDKTAMSNAWSSVFKVFDEALAIVRDLEPDSNWVDILAPRPIAVESSAGERYKLPIPEDCPVPKNLVPQLLLTDHFMIASYSNQQTDALAKSQPLSVGNEVIVTNQACCCVGYFDFGRLLRISTPWIVYAIETASGGELDDVLLEENGAMPAIKGSDIIDLWKALGSAGQVASVTTTGKDGGSVTRTVVKTP
ncbi:MAG: hypothetical protein SGI77_11360 [Pirellulaceae bacterium]|nr:hypothetical protein [Pirellulaceae bacterium]